VPNGQPERQLAPNHCLNYIPDGTQTYTAQVRDSSGARWATVGDATGVGYLTFK
jgi:hypothetical protein